MKEQRRKEIEWMLDEIAGSGSFDGVKVPVAA